jgi:hypothetical protein
MAIDTGGRDKDQEPDYEEILSDLEHKIDRLKVLYEQYFMGIEKIEPQTARKEVTRKILELTQIHIRNTGLRYRFNMLNQKFSTYVTYWNRTLRAIENGTYLRNVARAGREAARRGVELPDEVLRAMPPKMRERVLAQRARVAARQDARTQRASEGAKEAAPPPPTPAPSERVFGGGAGQEFDQEFDDMFGGLTRQKEEPRASAPRPQPPTSFTVPPPSARMTTPPPQRRGAALPPGMDEGQTQELYRRYVQAKKLLGENTDGIKYEHIVATISKQAPTIMQQHKAKGVEFSVVIKGDRVVLKATPKK